jgi:IS5 family transposase
VDLGYRGVDADNPGVAFKHRGKKKQLGALELKTLKRRQAIEPVIGHLKSDHRMGRSHLKGSLGDKLHVVLCAAGYNIRWLLRMIVKKGLGLIFLCLELARAIRAAKRAVAGWWTRGGGQPLFGAGAWGRISAAAA